MGVIRKRHEESNGFSLTNEVYVVSDTAALCICSPISYPELWTRRSRQTTPRGLVKRHATLCFESSLTYPIV